MLNEPGSPSWFVRPPATTMRAFSWLACWIADLSLVRVVLTRHGEQIVRGVSRRHAQIAVCRSQGIEALVLAVDQHRRRRIGLHHQPPAKLGESGLARGRLALPRARGDSHAVTAAHGKAEFSRPAATDVPIEPLRLGDHLEAAVGVADRLRAAKKQNAALAQREMEKRDDLRLRLGAQIDQKIAARNQVEARERRIGQHILHREDHRRAQFGQYPVTVILLRKEAGKPRRRHVRLDRFRVEALSGARDRIRVDIGGEDLQLDVALRRRDLLAEQHGEGIGLLARAAPGNPDAERLIGRVAADQVGNDLLRQEIEHLRIAEEAGDVDEQVLGKKVEFAGVAAQHFEIPIHVIGLDRRHRHAPLDPALQRARLVKREIVGGLRAQKIDDLGQPILLARPASAICSALRDSAMRWLYLTSASGILATGSTRSTAPVMIALRGMPS